MPEETWKSHDSTWGINVLTPKKTAVMTAASPNPAAASAGSASPSPPCAAVITKGAIAGERNDSDAVGSAGTAGISRP